MCPDKWGPDNWGFTVFISSHTKQPLIKKLLLITFSEYKSGTFKDSLLKWRKRIIFCNFIVFDPYHILILFVYILSYFRYRHEIICYDEKLYLFGGGTAQQAFGFEKVIIRVYKVKNV